MITIYVTNVKLLDKKTRKREKKLKQILQSDYNLCDKTTSGQFTVVNSPNVKAREPDALIPAPAQQCNGPGSTKMVKQHVVVLFARGNFISFAQI